MRGGRHIELRRWRAEEFCQVAEIDDADCQPAQPQNNGIAVEAHRRDRQSGSTGVLRDFRLAVERNGDGQIARNRVHQVELAMGARPRKSVGAEGNRSAAQPLPPVRVHDGSQRFGHRSCSARQKLRAYSKSVLFSGESKL